MKKLLCVLLIAFLLLPSAALADDEDRICGKWSFLLDVREEPAPGLDFGLLSLDLHLLEDGSCYLILGTQKLKKTAINYSYSDGMWIGDSSSFRIKTDQFLFDAWIDDDNALNIQFTDKIVFKLQRIVSVSEF